MSKRYTPKLSPIKETIYATLERLDPKTIMFKGPRIRGAPPPVYDAHGRLVRLPVKNNNSSRRSRKCRRKKRRKTKRNLAGCACSSWPAAQPCDCRRRARIELRAQQLREQREQDEREEWLRRENLRILNDAKQYNLKDEDGNDFTIENLEKAKRALSNYLQEQENDRRFNQALMDESLPTAEVTALPMGIPIPTTRWQRFKNFIKRKTRKVHPVSIVPESGKRKTRRKKRRRKRKKNLAGENNMCEGIHNFLKARKDPSFDEFKILPPFVSIADANKYCRRRKFKRCNSDEGKCVEPIDTAPIWLPPPPHPMRRNFAQMIHGEGGRKRRKRTRRKRRRKRR